jgi:hypothetical protein
VKRTQSYLAILMIIACGLTNGVSEAGQISTDPGSAGFYTVGGIRFSVPKGFRVLNKMSNADTSVLSNKKYDIGLIVKRVESKLSEKDAANLGSTVLQNFFSDKASFEWKRLEGDEKISKLEIQTERLLGFNGKGQALFQFRVVEAKGRKALVGYFACPPAMPDDKERFDKGLGFGCACDYEQAHIIASVTGESYDSIMQPGGISAPR